MQRVDACRIQVSCVLFLVVKEGYGGYPPGGDGRGGQGGGGRFNPADGGPGGPGGGGDYYGGKFICQLTGTRVQESHAVITLQEGMEAILLAETGEEDMAEVGDILLLTVDEEDEEEAIDLFLVEEDREDGEADEEGVRMKTDEEEGTNDLVVSSNEFFLDF